MENLLLIHGIATGMKTSDLSAVLSMLFKDKNIEKLWLDPYRENRAVAMFKEKLGM